MNTMAPARPLSAGLQARRARLTPGPAAAAEARAQVRAAISAWDIPVDADVAALLTSDLVTHAIRHAPAGAVVLGIRGSGGRLRVEVHHEAPAQSPPDEAGDPAGASAGGKAPPLLALASRVAAEWGCYRTPAGNAAYFTLACQPAAETDGTVRSG